jgi:hypothetical protein
MSFVSTWLRVFGVDLRNSCQALAGFGRYVRNRRAFLCAKGDDFAWGTECPVIGDWADSSGRLGAYFHQDLLVARWIFRAQPERHVDVGSRLDGFISHLAVFREVEVLDLRPQLELVPNVLFHQLDLMHDLPSEWVAATDSLSCLHTIEHFGLGRYGDEIDPAGYRKGLEQLKRMVAPGGILYLSTPMGPQRVEFNAHRVFSAETILGWFGEGWEIEKFAVIDDTDRVAENPERTVDAIRGDFGCRLGVGIVAARKTYSSVLQ